jgi:peroxiredoxin
VSIPHLSEMQKTFKDKNVVFVGISDESADTVKPFVQKQGDQMGYTVACDDERSSNAKYMEAYGQNGIPHAFVIDKSAKVIWHGHPMDGLEEALKQIVAGKYDISTAKKKEMAKSDLSEYQLAAIRGDEKATDMGRKLLVAAGDDKDALCELAFSIVANMQNRHRDFKLANEALDKAQKIAGKKDPQIMAVRSIGLFESGSHEEAVKMIKEAIDLSKDSAAQQANYNNFLRIMQMRVDSEKKAATKSEETPDKK